MAAQTILLTSEKTFKALTPISENISANYILPAIRLAQDIDLEPTIGTPLIKAIQEQIKKGKVEYKELVDDYIQPFLCYAAVAHLVPEVAFKIANAGVLRTDDEKMTNVSSSEVDKVMNHYKFLSDTYKDRLQKHLIANYHNYPELSQYKGLDELRANLYSAATCGLALGGQRGKIIVG